MNSTETIQVRLESQQEDRFERFRLISWWDQRKLAGAKVLVVGAGALGNEIIKNLALLGIGHLFIADLDRVENSNLSRSVLYRPADNGKSKARVAARAAKEIYPDIEVQCFDGNIVYDLGMGVYRWADVIIGGLDNREARLSINRACWRVNRPWIDGAIEQIEGCARVFVPDGDNDGATSAPCYECTMSETDWKLLQSRQSCNLLSRSSMEGGKTPTTPTISSIIAGVQCQEAVKLLHGLETIRGKGWVFSGFATDAYQVEYQRKEDCYSHDTLDEIIPLNFSSETTTAAELLAHARQLLGPTTELELGRDVLEKLTCPRCGRAEEMFCSLGRVSQQYAICPSCSAADDESTPMRVPTTFYRIRGNESFLGRSLAQIGVPPFDIIIARSATRSIGLELSADAPHVLGSLSDGEAVQWA
jgi:adenylyltransferase/sulfurtransferase